MATYNSFAAAQALGLNTTIPLTNNPAQTALAPNGFSVTSNLNTTGNTLPASKVQDLRTGVVRRDIIHWFVPQFGVVKMYVNPTNINTQHSKLITKDRTKGGFTLQYWGENLSEITLSGTTGSSGVEGIQLLQQIYRAEQYAFDSIGLSLAADNAVLGATNYIIDGASNAISNAIGTSVGNQVVGSIVGSSLAEGLLMNGVDNSGTFAPRNIPSLASVAFAIEMYYSGSISRGYFESMNIIERADNLGLFDYNMKFMVTQQRGYRQNQFGWNRSAIDGPSDNSTTGGIPLSWLKLGNQ